METNMRNFFHTVECVVLLVLKKLLIVGSFLFFEQNNFIYVYQVINTSADRYAMCITAQRDNALNDFVNDNTLE